jgi:hypothetical protein
LHHTLFSVLRATFSSTSYLIAAGRTRTLFHLILSDLLHGGAVKLCPLKLELVQLLLDFKHPYHPTISFGSFLQLLDLGVERIDLDGTTTD